LTARTTDLIWLPIVAICKEMSTAGPGLATCRRRSTSNTIDLGRCRGDDHHHAHADRVFARARHVTGYRDQQIQALGVCVATGAKL
jgi:hypothetical protein